MTRLKNPMIGVASFLIFYLVATITAHQQWPLAFPQNFGLSFALLVVSVVLLFIESRQLIRSQLQQLSCRSVAGFLFAALLVALLIYVLPRIIGETNDLTNPNSFQLPGTTGGVIAGLSYNLIYIFASVIAVLVVPASFAESAPDWQYLMPILIWIISVPLDNFWWQLLIIGTLWLALFLAYRLSHNFIFPLAIWLIFELLCDLFPITNIL
ncbi:hypothetical protein [Lapidilactobacillus wuchangensis]|uniref:hypothetical protein n=1 Tax=Lapidilactobacillus wuchangensis TaxID=2486001 RepID=UPI000F766B90|nr:hypothetical protein [Lapidilactobacillus wuchangensis]